MEKQIEEMAYSVCRLENKPKDCTSCMWKATCNEYLSAESYYNAGYRKQSEGEWVRKDGFFVCSNCDSTKPFAVIRDEIHYYGCNYCNKCGAKMKGGEG